MLGKSFKNMVCPTAVDTKTGVFLGVSSVSAHINEEFGSKIRNLPLTRPLYLDVDCLHESEAHYANKTTVQIPSATNSLCCFLFNHDHDEVGHKEMLI